MHLNSGDSFTIFSSNSGTTYTWQGEGSNSKEIDLAKKLESFLNLNQTRSELKEGGEPEEFWTLLGG